MTEPISVKTFGAVGDGKKDDFFAVQKAIDGAEGIFFPCGVYVVSDTVRVPSNRKLIFERGATLKLKARTKRKRGDFLLCNKNEKTGDENILIEGATFDGNNGWRNHKRPKDIFKKDGYSGVLINFNNVKNLVLRDVTLQNPVAYYTRFCRIDGFRLENVTLKSDRILPNQDGIHLAGEVRHGVVKNVRADSFGQTNDDLLALNADDFPGRIEEFDTVCGDIEDIVFEDVYAESCHDAVRLLSYVSAIRNIVFRNLNVGFRQRAVDNNAARGCRAELFKEEDCPRGVGRVENVLFENCNFWHTKEFPLGWKADFGREKHSFICWGSKGDNVRFVGCRFVPSPPLGGGFLQRKVNAARLRKYDGNDYPLFELIHLTDQTVTADGKIFKAVTKEDAVVLKRFEELSIAVTERPE